MGSYNAYPVGFETFGKDLYKNEGKKKRPCNFINIESTHDNKSFGLS